MSEHDVQWKNEYINKFQNSMIRETIQWQILSEVID